MSEKWKSMWLDNIKAEQIKSAPAIYISALTELLNEIVNEQKPTKNITDENLILLQKPYKPIGNIENLSPIILLSTIRKTLSTIALRKIRDDVDAYLSASQSAYRRGRSTSDIVWTHKWLSALIQKKKESFKILEIDLSSAFDTLDGGKLLEILKNNKTQRSQNNIHTIEWYWNKRSFWKYNNQSQYRNRTSRRWTQSHSFCGILGSGSQRSSISAQKRNHT